jgi:hypothetical protein
MGILGSFPNHLGACHLRRFLVPLLTCALVVPLAACDVNDPAPSAATTPPIAPVTPGSPNASPTPPAVPASPPATTGSPTKSCTGGWATPVTGSSSFTDPLGLIRRATGVKGPLVVVDMRRFTGPESPPSTQGYLLEVERWYVKLYAENDASFQGRFLVEVRRFGRGLVAVAPYGTAGFRSPDWVGFQYDSGDTRRRRYPGLPGRWSGIAYDFVRGGAGLKIPGLPDEVIGCLAGT